MANNQIALLAQAPVFDTPFESQGKALQLRNMMNQSQAADMEMQQKRQSMQEAAAQRSALQSDPTGGEGYLRALAAGGAPSAFFAAKKANLDAKKTMSDIGHTDAQTQNESAKAINQAFSTHRDMINTVNDPQSAAEWVKAGFNDPVIGPMVSRVGTVDQAISRIPQDPAGFAKWKIQAGLNSDQYVKLTTPDANAVLSANTSRANNSASIAASNANSAASRAQADRHFNASQAAGKVPAGYRANADGSWSYIPGGPADPNSAGSGKPLTENQGKAVALGMRAIQAEETVKGLDASGFDSLNLKDRAAAAVPLDFGRGAMSDQAQQYENAQRNFISAVLRKESGAAISTQEFENERKKYFPQVSDGASVRAQKAQQRALAIEGLKAEAGQQGVRSMTGAPIKRASDLPSAAQSNPAIPSGWSVKEN